MAKISANGAKGHHKFTLTVTETDVTESSNTSTLSYSFVLSPVQTGWDWSGWGSKISYSFNINGTVYTGTIPSYNGSSTVTLKSGTQTVAHDADGKKRISYSFSVTDGAGKSYTPGNASASGTLDLTSIPRGATLLTAPNFIDGANPTITYSNPAGNSVTSLEAGIFNEAGGASYAPYRDISTTGTSYTFTLTDAEKENLRKAAETSNTITVRFYIRTVLNGETYYSNLARTFSISDANPIITASVVDTNETTIALTGNSSKLIKYYSNATATMSAEGQKGAAINESMYIIRNGDDSGYGTTHTFNNVENNVFYFYAEDSRGNVGSDAVTLPMVDYIRLTCNIADNKPDGDGDVTVVCSGNFFNGSFGAVSNTITVQCRYKVSGGSFGEWTDMTVTTNGNTYYATAYLSGLDYQLTHTFEARAIDKLDTVSSTGSPVKSIPMFHWGENDFVFEVPVTFNAGTTGGGSGNIEGDCNITGDLRLKGDENYGNYLRFGDGNYCYIAELTDDVMTIKASRINLEANGVYVYGNAIPVLEKGIWSPELDDTAISSYTTQYGWYSKMGQTVTVGFFIKAQCYTGYDGIRIEITGLPYTPLFAAAGGGMCSGAYVTGMNDFQCFVAETSGVITTRVQNCNNTTTTNLNTSASGCFYRFGGGEITLSGTITYMSNS